MNWLCLSHTVPICLHDPQIDIRDKPDSALSAQTWHGYSKLEQDLVDIVKNHQPDSRENLLTLRRI